MLLKVVIILINITQNNYKAFKKRQGQVCKHHVPFNDGHKTKLKEKGIKNAGNARQQIE